jgi:hypothetical protein
LTLDALLKKETSNHAITQKEITTMTKYKYTVKITLKAPIEIEADTEKEALEKFDRLYSDLLIDEGSCGSIERDFENSLGISLNFDDDDFYDGYRGSLHHNSIIELLDNDENVVFPHGPVQLDLWVDRRDQQAAIKALVKEYVEKTELSLAQKTLK